MVLQGQTIVHQEIALPEMILLVLVAILKVARLEVATLLGIRLVVPEALQGTTATALPSAIPV